MISVGDKLDGKYVVTRQLGRGGFGQVFLATDEAIPDRQVAIKVLSRPREGDHGDLLTEMRTLAQFNHPHVVTFFHHFSDSHRLYLVMEYCPKGSLDDLIVTNGKLPIDTVFRWAVDLCETLAFVHGKKIVHHDIKPQNILFARDGRIKLGDFGVANSEAGTLLYMPPEMLLGERVTRHDPRVDVYALGLTILEAITGEHPFENVGRDQVVQARVRHDFVRSDLPRWVQEVLLKATNPAPELRFQNGSDFAEAIRGRHVPYVFDLNRIRAGDFATRAESALRRRKWMTAEKLASHARSLAPDSVAALIIAGRCELVFQRIDRAEEHFSRALAISPRTAIQKELGWINMERGNIPTAISLLTDHLQRNASDYEAYNLLLKCFYLSDNCEAGAMLANTVIDSKPANNCFLSNLLLCRILSRDYTNDQLAELKPTGEGNPFISYNLQVRTEDPSSWSEDGNPALKSKLIFQEFHFGVVESKMTNTVGVYAESGNRYDQSRAIISFGTLKTNNLTVSDESVSRRHCAIVNYSGNVWLYDLGSTVGTFVDGKRLAGRTFLSGVHDVTIGTVKARIAARSDMLV